MWFPSTSLYYISLYLGWNDQHRNTNMNDKDHLVGQLTKTILDLYDPVRLYD